MICIRGAARKFGDLISGGKKIECDRCCRAFVCDEKREPSRFAFLLVEEAGMAKTTSSQNNAQGYDYKNFVHILENYCEAQLAFAKGKKPNPNAARDLVGMFTHLFPRLANSIRSGTSEQIYAIRIMAFGVKGLKDDVYEMIWQKHFLDGERINQLAERFYYSERQLRRKIALFPKRVADQLAERNEGDEAWLISPATVPQGKAAVLQKQYHLTFKQATVLWAFLEHDQPAGRKAIAKELGISIETLRDHISAIIHRMGVQKFNQAVDVARKILRDENDRIGEDDPYKGMLSSGKEDYLNVE
jgi:DNA-binding CsgD family transcriptional regulator